MPRVWVGLPLLVGCGLSAGEAIAAQVRLFCEAAHHCRDWYVEPPEPIEPFEARYGSTESECVEILLGQYGDVQASVDAGRILYDARDAEECIDRTYYGRCADFWRGAYVRPAACETAFVGIVPDGGFCTSELDCVDPSSRCFADQICD